jgi:uncharacterized membrane protein
MSDSERRSTTSARDAGRSVYEEAVDVVLTGIVVIVPIVVTVYILQTAFEFITSVLTPLVQVLEWAGIIDEVKFLGLVQFLVDIGLYQSVGAFLTELIALLLLFLTIVVVGIVARNHYGERLIDFFDYLIGAVPAVGTIYRSFRRMGDVVLESGVENFRDVKLVEFPKNGIYVLGFVTNRAPLPIQQELDVDGMTTLFLPLAPNPVMGGFLTYIPDGRIHDVDMTVEDAVRTIVTSGIATEERDGEYRHLSDEELEELDAAGTAGTREHSDEP